MMNVYQTWRFALAAGVIVVSSGDGQQLSPHDSPRKWIERGNQAWIEGMKSGNVEMIAATYAKNAVDCPAAGECLTGRQAISEHLKDRMAHSGRAQSADVTSNGSVRQGDYVYEWGVAQASFGNGRTIGGHYLTVWQFQTDGSWKIFRNLAIPGEQRR